MLEATLPVNEFMFTSDLCHQVCDIQRMAASWSQRGLDSSALFPVLPSSWPWPAAAALGLVWRDLESHPPGVRYCQKWQHEWRQKYVDSWRGLQHRHTSTWYPNLSLSRCQTMGDCSDQGGPFAAAAVWEDKPDVALWEQPTHNFTEAIWIPEMDSVKLNHSRSSVLTKTLLSFFIPFSVCLAQWSFNK